MSRFALEGGDLTKAFGGVTALKSVDVHLAPGEIVGVLGPNGSGKTTLMSVLAGLLRPDRGHIEIGGRDVTNTAPFKAARRLLSCTLQTPRVFDSLTVEENLQLAFYAKGIHKSSSTTAIDELLERLQISRTRSQRVGALSGGQRKLIDLARALIVGPRILLADEPTAGVSHAARTLVTDELHAAAARGAAILLVSHDLPWAFSVCDRIMFLTRGELLAEGGVAELRSDPRIRDAYLR